MKRSWTVRRQPQAAPDAEQRWDRAFQHLLRCANPAPPPPAVVQAADHEEVIDESRTLCPRLDQSPGADAVD
jgi:acetyl esterase/lipase